MATVEEMLTSIANEIADVKKLVAAAATPPAPTGGLFDFVRPDPVEPRYGEGIPMTSPDVAEAMKRALYGVTWAGTVARAGTDYDDVWVEIESLKVAGQFDPIVEPYLAMLPETAGFALLTGLIGLPKWDGLGSDRQAQRKALAGKSVQEILNGFFAATGGPSGNA